MRPTMTTKRNTNVAILLLWSMALGWDTNTVAAYTIPHRQKSSLQTSPLFRTRTSFSSHLITNIRNRSVTFLSDSDDDINGQNEAKDAEIIGKKSSSTSSSSLSPPTSTTLLQKFDDFGLSLKPRAFAARAAAASQTDRTKQILYKMKECAYFALFIAYRGYRGFFVVLPAVFREVFRKMKTAVDTPFTDDGAVTAGGGDDGSGVQGRNVATTAVVSVLAGMLTFYYVITGFLRVLMMFVKTASSTKSMDTAFESAADEMLTNEEKIMSVSKKNLMNGGK